MAAGKIEALWQQRNEHLLQTARDARVQSDTLRRDAGRLHRETSAHLQRSAREVEATLALRIDDVELKRSDLSLCLDAVLAEAASLQLHKGACEAEVAGKDAPREVTRACQQLRAQRRGPDLLDDEVDAALRGEAALLERQQGQFRDLVDECAEQLRLLRVCQRTLDDDLAHKCGRAGDAGKSQLTLSAGRGGAGGRRFAAYDIDTQCATLDHTSRTIALNPGVKATASSNAVTPDSWSDFSDRNMAQARMEVAKSVALRERIDGVVKANFAEQGATANAVEGAFNRRIAQYTDARLAALTDQKKLQLEQEAQNHAIADLEAAIADQDLPLKARVFFVG